MSVHPPASDLAPDPAPHSSRCAAPGPSAMQRLRGHLPHLLGLMLLGGAVWVVHREMRAIHLADIRAALSATPHHAVLMAALWTLVSYGTLSFYDRLATIYAGHRIAYLRTAFASFVSYVLSHNLGFAAVSGAAVRYRLYANWGLGAAEIARVVAFCSLTFILGALVLGGVVLLAAPGAVAHLLHAPRPLLWAIGAGMWLAVAAYATLSTRIRHVTLFGHRIDLPGPATALRQIVLATAELGATAAIAYAALPSETLPGAAPFGYLTFLAIYLAAYTAGLAANIPGGLGVFDGAMLVGLSPWFPTPAILSAIVIFRLFYYIIPLFLAGALFAAHEILLRGGGLIDRLPAGLRPGERLALIREADAEFAASTAVGAVGLSGAMLLALTVLDDTPGLVRPDIPWYSMDVATLAAAAFGYVPSLIGVALLVLAVGLKRRVSLAWSITIGTLAAAAAITVAQGYSPVVPLILAAAAAIIAPFRRSYYRQARLLSEPLHPATALPVLLLVASEVAFVSMNHRLEAMGATSWWAVIFAPEGVPGGIRIGVALAVLCSIGAGLRLILPGHVHPLPWGHTARQRYLALNEGTSAVPSPACVDYAHGLVPSDNGRAAYPFRRVDRLLVGLGDPVGTPADRVAAIWRLRDLATQEGRELAIWRAAGGALLRTYSDIGLVPVHIATPQPGAPAGAPPTYLCCDARHAPALLARLPSLFSPPPPRRRPGLRHVAGTVTRLLTRTLAGRSTTLL